MRVEVLVPHGARANSDRSQLYTYRAAPHLRALLQPGHLVAVPFGEKLTAGIVWTLDATDDIADSADSADGAPDDPASASGETRTLRPIEALLLPDPIILPHLRDLAEWLAYSYNAPLAAAIRFFLPPGLLSSLRVVLRPGEPARTTPPGESSSATPLGPDEAALLALLREHGRLERSTVVAALGASRARSALRVLSARRAITLSLDIGDVFSQQRRERRIRLTATPAALDVWRVEARARLDALLAERGAAPDAAPDAAPGAARSRPARPPQDRAAERLLQQLAVLDVLARPADGLDASDTARAGGWQVEALRRLTRSSETLLAGLQAANLVEITEVETRRDPLAGRHIPRTHPLRPTPAQAAALNTLRRSSPAARHDGHDNHDGHDGHDDAPASASRVFLLHGITGSGKTEVYLQALEAVLARGERGMVLVPEIALTPQAIARFAGRFPGRVALLHSALTDAERLDEWRRIRTGAVDVVVGSRSALFAPIERLGLIVVDEEHEAAYKEERAPTYHARDVAIRLGALTGADVVLGSATPAVESYWHATRGEYTLVELNERAPAGAPSTPVSSKTSSADTHTDQPAGAYGGTPGLPIVRVVDLRAELRAGHTSILSQPLQDALHATLQRGEQAILFLNRRGTASSVVCRECGYVVCCTRCDVSMTFHAGERVVICHYCGAHSAAPTTCPLCGSASIRYFGLGTERVEGAVKHLFPAARVLRWDRDTARTRQAHEELLRAFSERRADVLVGTQMIAKGLDLPSVTLVGVVSADVALFLPDFRASERAFQLLTQVAGRAGRGAQAGQVLIQTFNPEHFCIQAAATHNYTQFLDAEMIARERFAYPPFRRFIKCTYAHRDRYTAQIEATVLYDRLQQVITQLGLPDTDLVGPAPAFLERLRGLYRWQVFLRGPDPSAVLRALHADDLPPGWSVDVDPASTL